MPSLSQLESQIQKLQRRADVLREKKSTEVIASIRALMKQYGLSTADLAKAGVAGGKRGRPVGSKNGLTKTVKAENGHAQKGKLPPKYRDPVSGLTWSGHARPPAWIKDAPDRDAFLIAGSRIKSMQVKSAGRPASKKATRKRMAESAAA